MSRYVIRFKYSMWCFDYNVKNEYDVHFRCDDLTSAVQAERGRCEELQSALEREASLARHTRLELDNERKMTSEARDHERATISDLQAILG